jgi:hypothetical protein
MPIMHGPRRLTCRLSPVACRLTCGHSADQAGTAAEQDVRQRLRGGRHDRVQVVLAQGVDDEHLRTPGSHLGHMRSQAL